VGVVATVPRMGSGGGVAFRGCCGVYFLRNTRHPTVVHGFIHPAAGFVCAIPAAHFLWGGSLPEFVQLCNTIYLARLHDCANVALVAVGYTSVAIISLDSWDSGAGIVRRVPAPCCVLLVKFPVGMTDNAVGDGLGCAGMWLHPNR